MSVRDQIEAALQRAVAADHFGLPSARKGGRNPKWPYVPVVKYTHGGKYGVGYTQQLKGKAFVTRDQAVTYARHRIEQSYRSLRRELLRVGNRALREDHGLPRELDLPIEHRTVGGIGERIAYYTLDDEEG